jgi:hypothetical protein
MFLIDKTNGNIKEKPHLDINNGTTSICQKLNAQWPEIQIYTHLHYFRKLMIFKFSTFDWLFHCKTPSDIQFIWCMIYYYMKSTKIIKNETYPYGTERIKFGNRC